jgi:hypothetical protein
VSLDLLAGNFLRLAATYGSSHCGGQYQSVTGAAGRLAGATMQVYPATLPLGLLDPRFAFPWQPDSIASCSAVPRQPLQHGQQLPPVIESADVVVSQAAACDDWIASRIVAAGHL